MRTILSLGLCLLLTTGASAQTDDTELKVKAVENAKARTEQLTLQLGLTPEQSQVVLQAMTEAEMKALPERKQCQAIEARVKSLFDGAYAQVSTQLTPDQAAKLEAMRKEGAINTSCCQAEAKAGCDHANGKAACCAGGKAAAPDRSLEKTEEKRSEPH